MREPVVVTHVGGPTVLLETAGVRLLTDPTFDEPGRRYRFGPGASSTKTAGPARSAAEIGPVDVVLLTHDHHADNLDETGRQVASTAPVVITTRAGAGRLGGRAVGLKTWSTAALTTAVGSAVRVTATPCRHGPPLSRRLVGDVVGFAVEVGDSGVVWFSGDTVLFGGVRDVARRLRVDIAIVHVGAVRFGLTGPLRYTMGIADAVTLVDGLRPRVAVPVHYEGWSHFSEVESAVRSRLGADGGHVRPPFRMIERGVPTDLST